MHHKSLRELLESCKSLAEDSGEDPYNAQRRFQCRNRSLACYRLSIIKVGCRIEAIDQACT